MHFLKLNRKTALFITLYRFWLRISIHFVAYHSLHRNIKVNKKLVWCILNFIKCLEKYLCNRFSRNLGNLSIQTRNLNQSAVDGVSFDLIIYKSDRASRKALRYNIYLSTNSIFKWTWKQQNLNITNTEITNLRL